MSTATATPTIPLLRLDPAERRDPEGAGPVLEQRVLGGGFGAKGWGLLRHIGHMGFDLLHCTLGGDRGQESSISAGGACF